MLAGDTGLNGSFDATEVGWLAQYASDYDGPGKGWLLGTRQHWANNVLHSRLSVNIAAFTGCGLRAVDDKRLAPCNSTFLIPNRLPLMVHHSPFPLPASL